VAHLHDRGVAHRDLKLENFLYESQSSTHLKLVDFGVATRFGGSAMHELAGSLDYIAPEVMAGEYTEKADVWSIGVVAYMLLCGHTPWKGDEARVRKQIRAGKPNYKAKRFQALSVAAQAFVRALLTPDASMRPSAAEVLAHPWLNARHSSIRRSLNSLSSSMSSESLTDYLSRVSKSTGSLHGNTYKNNWEENLVLMAVRGVTPSGFLLGMCEAFRDVFVADH